MNIFGATFERYPSNLCKSLSGDENDLSPETRVATSRVSERKKTKVSGLVSRKAKK